MFGRTLLAPAIPIPPIRHIDASHCQGGRLAREYIEFGAKRSADRVTQISELERTLEKLEKQIKKLEGVRFDPDCDQQTIYA